MFDLLPDGPLLSAFLIASLLLAVTPGPGVLYIVARSLGEGRRAGLASVAGVAAGNLANAFAAAIGLAALFSISALAFMIVKYAGAIYLVYLGIQMWRRPAVAPADVPPTALPGVFRDGFIVALFNPKTTLFFAAFLPQFMHADAAPLPQSLMLGALFVAIATVTDSLYALGAGALAPMLKRLRGSPAFGRRLKACEKFRRERPEGKAHGAQEPRHNRQLGEVPSTAQRRHRGAQQKFSQALSGSLFIGLGVFAALTGQRK